MPPVSRGRSSSSSMTKAALRERVAAASRKRKPETEIDPRRIEPDTAPALNDPFNGFRHASDSESDDGMGDEESNERAEPHVFRPGKHNLAPDETLICDESAYNFLHTYSVEWPALSFDFVSLDANAEYNNIDAVEQNTYPLSLSLILGSQARQANKNKLTCLRVSNLFRSAAAQKKRSLSLNQDSDDDSEDDDDSNDDEEMEKDDDDAMKTDQVPTPVHRKPVLQSSEVRFDSVVNRIRVMPQKANISAICAESQRVYLIDTKSALHTIHLDSAHRMLPSSYNVPPSKTKPFFSHNKHGDEGYALDWSRVVPGRFLTGACNGTIYMCEPVSQNASTWTTRPSKFIGHKQSVEDIQWSPNEREVFASCSCDKSIRIWDAREHRRSVLSVENAHATDVNVMSWNRNETHLLVSGGDDGTIKVWDMRYFGKGANDELKAAAEFNLHQKAITCVQWHPKDSSMLLAGSEDGSVSIWDLAVERDAEEELKEGVVVKGAEELPPQLLFLHMGQKNVKDAQWCPGANSVVVSSAFDGINVFQAANIVLPT